METILPESMGIYPRVIKTINLNVQLRKINFRLMNVMILEHGEDPICAGQACREDH